MMRHGWIMIATALAAIPSAATAQWFPNPGIQAMQSTQRQQGQVAEIENQRRAAEQNGDSSGGGPPPLTFTPPAGWQEQPGGAANNIMVFESSTAPAMRVLVSPVVMEDQGAAITRLQSMQQAMPFCSAADDMAEPSPGRFVLNASGNSAARCRFIAVPQAAGGYRYFFALAQGATAPSLERMGAILDSFAATRAAPARPAPVLPPRVAAAPARPAATVSAPRTGSALARVPTASRPIAFALSMESRFGGQFFYQVVQPWAIFANGYASNGKCANWNPLAGPPTPATEQAAGDGNACVVRRWRRTAAGYAFLDSSGSWSEPTNDLLPPFRAGERVTADLINQSGYGTADVPGQVSIHSLAGGSLRMSSAGRIAVGSWSSVVVSGGNSDVGIGGGSSSEARPVEGQYELSGHMIAITAADGSVRYGLIARDIEDGTAYIYLNGSQYYPEGND